MTQTELLLRNPQMSVASTAERVGHETGLAFRKVFKAACTAWAAQVLVKGHFGLISVPGVPVADTRPLLFVPLM